MEKNEIKNILQGWRSGLAWAEGRLSTLERANYDEGTAANELIDVELELTILMEKVSRIRKQIKIDRLNRLNK